MDRVTHGCRAAYNLVGLSKPGVPSIHWWKPRSPTAEVQVTKGMFWLPFALFLSYFSIGFKLRWRRGHFGGPSCTPIPEFAEILGFDNDVFILAGRKRGFSVATVVLFHLKNFSRYRRLIFLNTVSNILLPIPGPSFAESAIFILGQPSSFTIRNQSTAGNGHEGTGKTLKPDYSHLSGQCTWHPEGPHDGGGVCSKAEHVYLYGIGCFAEAGPGIHMFLP